MSKYEFEWDDEQAQAVQDVLVAKAESASEGRLFFSNVAQRIEEQKPSPLPTGYGAVIVSKEHGMLIRVRKDNDLLTEWTQPHGEVFSSAEVGTVTEVLSEGLVQE